MLYTIVRLCLALVLLEASNTNYEVSARVEGALQPSESRIRGNGYIESGLIHKDYSKVEENWDIEAFVKSFK